MRIGLCQFIVIERLQSLLTRAPLPADTGTDWRTSLVGDIHLAAIAEAERTLMRGFNTVRNIGRLQKIAGEPALPVARRHAPGGSPVAAEKTRVK